jgi:hypothetical protein
MLVLGGFKIAYAGLTPALFAMRYVFIGRNEKYYINNSVT